MKSGVYDDIPFAEYCSIDAVNKSSLDLFAISALHYLHRDRTNKDTPAKRLGTAIHTAILEPDRFKEEYRAEPSPEDFPQALCSADDYKRMCERMDLPKTGTKEVLKARIQEVERVHDLEPVPFFDEIEAELAKYKLLKKDQLWTALSIAENVRTSPIAQVIMGEGKAERTLIWVDEETGVLCKCRLDWLLNDFSIALDIKSTQLGGASPHKFQKACAEYNYHRQAAWYLDGVKALSGIDAQFIFGAYETESPYASAFYYASQRMIEQGRSENRYLLNKYVHCKKTNEWPGYSETIEPIDLPPWKSLDREMGINDGQ